MMKISALAASNMKAFSHCDSHCDQTKNSYHPKGTYKLDVKYWLFFLMCNFFFFLFLTNINDQLSASVEGKKGVLAAIPEGTTGNSFQITALLFSQTDLQLQTWEELSWMDN